MGYRHLLLAVLVVYVLVIVVPGQAMATLLRMAVIGGLVMIAVRTHRRAGALAWPALILAVAGFTATLAAALGGNERALSAVTGGSTAVLVSVVILVIGRQLLAAGVVDAAAVRGVLVVYLLLALLFGSLHQCFGALQDGYLNGAGAYPNASAALYFSVITLATVGYGDIVPASDLARAVAVTEALAGQLYLVSVVAAVVARYQRG